MLLGLIVLSAAAPAAETGLARIVCDADSDCYYLPDSTAESMPALVVLHCDGAVAADLDSMRLVGDSLGWALATCHATRNRRDLMLNDRDIVATIDKLLARYPVDPDRVFLFGYSGQGVQALATMFLHPAKVAGVAAVCAHGGALGLADWARLNRHHVHLVTREHDWNRGECEAMARLMEAQGIGIQLVVTPGKHDAGPRGELLEACRWLDAGVGR